MTWLNGWNRRKSKIVNGTTAGAQTDFQLQHTVYKNSRTDTATAIYLGTNVRSIFTRSISVWTKIPSIPAI